MSYGKIPDQLILNYPLLKIAIFEEVKPLYIERPYIIEKWKKEAYQMTEGEKQAQSPTHEMGPSFRALYYLFSQTLYFQQHITKQMITEAVNKYKDTVKVILTGHLINEFPDEVKRSVNEEKIEEALNLDYIYSSMDIDYHLMRDIVTKKKDFKEGEAGYLATEIIDTRGKVKGYAELRPLDTLITEVTSDQHEMWLELIESTINSLDEMTADLFDLITYLWMVTPKNPDGYIEFHSNDALRLRNLKKRTAHGRELDFREEDRFNIMKRVAALSSIWVSLGDQQVKVVNTKDIQDNELYKFKDFQKMFEIGKVRVAYDKKTGEAKGIYAVQVKPTSILTPYLEGPNRTIGLLDLKVFQYSHFTQREHKRLTRYLNLQWKIRTLKRSLQQPFKVATLLKVMDISSRYNGVQVRDKFENVLDELQRDGIIHTWSYLEEVNEDQVGKKGWIRNYWTKLNVIILPTDWVIKENQKNLLVSPTQIIDEKIVERMKNISAVESLVFPSGNVAPHSLSAQIETAAALAHVPHSPFPQEEEWEQPSFELEEEIALTPTTMKEAMSSMKISIRQAAGEIGIAHTTLSRYLTGQNKRQNKNNDEKMFNWLKSHINTAKKS